MPNLIGERPRPIPPPPAPSEAAPGVSRHLFRLFFQVEIRHRHPPWRHPIAGAKWGRESDTIMAILSSLFRHENVGLRIPRATHSPSQRQALSGRLDAEPPVAQKGANLLNELLCPRV